MGLNASFTGARLSGLTRNSTILEYDGTVSGAGNLIDVGGENLCPYSETFENWTQTRVSTISNQYKNPINGAFTADILHEDNTPGSTHCFQAVYSTISGHVYTFSAYVMKNARNWTQLFIWDTGGRSGNFNLNTGVSGVTSNIISSDIQKVDGNWFRVNIRFVCTLTGVSGFYIFAAEADNDITFDGLDQDSLVVYGAQIVDNTDNVILGPGIYHPTTATIKPRHDLAPSGTPPTVLSDLQGADGNKLPARSFDGVTQFYSKAHHDSMNVFDSDHTLTMVIHHVLGADTDELFSHVTATAGCRLLFANGLNIFRAQYSNAGGNVLVPQSGSISTSGLTYILQLVRSSNIATLYVNGVAGTPVDVTGYGLDGSATLILGQTLEGNLSYTRLDSEALSADALAKDREAIRGIMTNWSRDNAWTFSRSSTAYQTYSNGTMAQVAANIPRVGGPGGGVLIEAAATQLHGLTEAFDSWTEIGGGDGTVTPNNYIAPNGTLTADLVDNTAGLNTDYWQIETANLGTLTSKSYIFSAYIRADTPHVCTLALTETGVDTSTANVSVTTEWQRFTVVRTCAGGGTGTLRPGIYPGESGVAVGAAHFWGANLVESKFATSYIPNSGAATTTVTKTADSMTIDPHPANSNEYIIPELFSPTGVATKLTVEFEMKAEYNSSTDMPSYSYVCEISGNAGTANNARNRLNVATSSGGRILFYFYDDSLVVHSIESAINTVPYNQWHKYKFFIDLADLSRMDAWIDGSNTGMTYTARTGTATFDTTNCLLRLGMGNTGGVVNYTWFRNLRISPSEF